MSKKPLVLLTSIGLLGCSSAPQRGPRTDPSPPRSETPARDAEETPPVDPLEREIPRPLEPRAVRAPDGAWSTTVEAAGIPSLEIQHDSVRVDVPIGTEAPIECTVYTQSVEAAGTIANLLRLTGDHVRYDAVAPAGIAVAAEAPAFFVTATYVTSSSEGPGLGQLKAMVHTRPVHPVVCLHDEPGYAATFQRISLGLSEQLQFENANPPAPAYREVSVVKLDAEPVGFVTRVIEEQPGQYRTRETLSMLLPGPRFIDDLTEQKTDTEGRIDSGTWISAVNGRIVLRAEVVREPNGAYVYSSRVGKEEKRGRFSTKTAFGLTGTLAAALRIRRELIATDETTFEAEEYHPTTDPTSPTPVTYAQGADDPHHVTLSQGTTMVDGVVDERGFFRKYHATLGRSRMGAERLLVVGAPRLPAK